MNIEENATIKKDNTTIINNIKREYITIRNEETKEAISYPYCIIAVDEKTITAKKGMEIRSIPIFTLPYKEEINLLREELEKQNTKKTTPKKTSKTTIKGKKQTPKEEDEGTENDKK